MVVICPSPHHFSEITKRYYGKAREMWCDWMVVKCDEMWLNGGDGDEMWCDGGGDGDMSTSPNFCTEGRRDLVLWWLW